MSEFKEYKVGEKIVYHSLPYSRLFYVKAVLGDSIVVRECWDEAGAKSFSEFPPYADIRPAKPSEIKAGFKEGTKEFDNYWYGRSEAEEVKAMGLLNDMGDDFPIENHISPNCKVTEAHINEADKLNRLG
ncbi:hypothetical protein [Acinetobacter pittii]|uniref:hypothetical protein n=1 Tax=Acinetobacter pittii TaxID=48296 RepID=UPI00300D5B2D